MILAELCNRAAVAYQSATPAPTPMPDPGVGSVGAGNYIIAALLFVGSVGVIAIALRFAWLYHSKVLGVISEAVEKEHAPIATERGAALTRAQIAESPVQIDGAATGTPSAKLTYSLVGSVSKANIQWVAKGGDPSKSEGARFATRFDKGGSYTVTATYTDTNQEPQTVSKKVTVAATTAPKSTPSIVLPFVLQNWGRLVIVILGVGVVSALMSTRALDAAAGVGILGTLLGVGAVSATAGTSGDKTTKGSDD